MYQSSKRAGIAKPKAWVALVLASFFPPVAPAEQCYESSIISPAPFMGNDGEIFKLSDGTVWQVKYEYEYLYEYYPEVMICPDSRRLLVNKKSLNVVPVAKRPTKATAGSRTWDIYEETNLEGSISGTIKSGTIFKTISGNVYEVTGLTLQLVLELQPDVMVLRRGDTYKLVVEGFKEPVICRKLN